MNPSHPGQASARVSTPLALFAGSIAPFSGSRIAVIGALAALATTAGTNVAQAARTWDGGGTGNVWSSGQNWNGSSGLSNGDDLFFDGTVKLSNTNDVLTSIGTITFNNASGAFVLGGNTATLAGDVINNDDSLQTLNLGLNMSATRTFDAASGNLLMGGVLGQTAAAGLTKTGSFALTLTNSNSYTGTTTISAGILNIQHANALGTTAGSTSVTSGAALEIQGAITTAAEGLTLNGTGISAGGALRSISGNNNYTGVVSLASASRVNSDAGTLTLSGGITGNFAKTFGGAGNISVTTAAISGSGGVTKDGSGVVRFGVTNSYTGGTTVSAGTLLANATSATSSGAVSVASTGTLGGTGSIAPTGTNGINVSGALAPGDGVGSVGTLTLDMSGTTGTATMASGATFAYNLGLAGANISSVGSSDLLAITGASSGDFTFNNNVIDFLGGGFTGYYKLFDTSSNNANTWSGLSFNPTTGVIASGLTISNLASGTAGALLVGTASNGGNVGDIYLRVIPEPSTAILGSLGVGMLMFRRRRIPS